MSVLLRMNSFKHSFSPAELKIFQYVEKNPEQASHMTAKQLAQAANVSAPSVVRFTKKIGYTSLTD
ncbi:MurR/RpiR family transcriptional regulator, partial [Enterococcus italicus]